MIFEDEPPPAMADPAPALSAPDRIIEACATEAGRLADAIGGIDRALSAVLGGLADPPLALQGIDLLRQEAEGLAAALALVAEAAASGRPVSAGEIARAVTLHDQCARLRTTRKEKGGQ